MGIRLSLIGCLLGGLLAFIGASTAVADEECAVAKNAVDYRDRTVAIRKHISQVEGAHFTASVRRGVQGNTGSLMADLNYTLSHIPNHPRALLVTAMHQMSPDYVPYYKGRIDYRWPTTDCYFKTAFRMAPDDPAVHLVQGIYFHRLKKYDQAEKSYVKALDLAPEYAEAHYNLGLLYVDRKKLDKARLHADKAYELGYPLQGLRKKLGG